jgi:acetyltransferase-like isoleucine patch superfamily enzyme
METNLPHIQKLAYILYVSIYRRIAVRVQSAIVRAKLWFQGVTIGKHLIVEGPVEVGDGRSVILGDNVRLGKNIYLGAWKQGKLIIGDNSYIGRWTIILAYQTVTIGSDCLIAPGCHITDVNHGIAPGELIRKQPLISKPVRSGKNVNCRISKL